MTFCVGIKVEDGLIGIADTRITSGTECTMARKVTIHQHGEHQTMFVMTSGLRSVRDKALTYFQEVIDESDEGVDKLYKAVNSLAEQVRRVAHEDKPSLIESGLNFNLFALVGGQFQNDNEPKLYLLYPQGNWIEIGPGSPYFIIGNSGYGKPLLDRVLRYNCSMKMALQTGFLAFDATRTSSNDVDYPIDVVYCLKNSFKTIEQRFQKDDLQRLSLWWQERISSSVNELPHGRFETLFSKFPRHPEEEE